MARNFLLDYNLLAVSANLRESAINTEQTLDTVMMVAEGDVIQLDARRESNANMLTGLEEPDTVFDLGRLVNYAVNFEKAQAQHFGWLLSYALGVSTPAAWGTGYQHAILPTTQMLLPSFTSAQRMGNWIMKRRFASNFVNTVTATFAKDAWAKLVGEIKGTGKYVTNMYKETVTANWNATSLTLASNGVQGATAALRLDNVHSIRAKDPNTPFEWVEVTFSAVSAASPAVITMTAPGGTATSTTYEILYVPTESGWMSFPSRIDEPPLRVVDLAVKIGGTWNGSAFSGGRTLSDEINSIEYKLDNQMVVEYRVGGTGAYANYGLRKGRVQTIKLNRQARDYLLQQKIIDNETLGIYMKATGAQFDTGPKNYYVELIFPKCAILSAPLSSGDKVIAEAGDIIVLQDATYGSILANVGNKLSGYAQ